MEFRYRASLVLIGIAGAGSRLFHLNKTLWHDESFSAGGYILTKPLSELLFPFGNHYFEHLFVRFLLWALPARVVDALSFETLFRQLPFLSSIALCIALFQLVVWYFAIENRRTRLGIFAALQLSALIHWYAHDGRSSRGDRRDDENKRHQSPETAR